MTRLDLPYCGVMALCFGTFLSNLERRECDDVWGFVMRDFVIFEEVEVDLDSCCWWCFELEL